MSACHCCELTRRVRLCLRLTSSAVSPGWEALQPLWASSKAPKSTASARTRQLRPLSFCTILLTDTTLFIVSPFFKTSSTAGAARATLRAPPASETPGLRWRKTCPNMDLIIAGVYTDVKGSGNFAPGDNLSTSPRATCVAAASQAAGTPAAFGGRKRCKASDQRLEYRLPSLPGRTGTRLAIRHERKQLNDRSPA